MDQFLTLTSLTLSLGLCSHVIMHFPIITISFLYCKPLFNDHFVNSEMASIMLILLITVSLLTRIVLDSINFYWMNEWIHINVSSTFSQFLILFRHADMEHSIRATSCLAIKRNSINILLNKWMRRGVWIWLLPSSMYSSSSGREFTLLIPLSKGMTRW